MKGADAPYDRLGSGTVDGLRTGAGEKNHLMAIVIGERGWFFVNDVFVAEVGLRDMTHAGDVAVITGAYIGDVVAGAVTRYENFTGRQLTRQYGPADGKLEWEEQGSIPHHPSGVWARDLVVEAEFVNPEGGDWSYGFSIRNPEFDRLDVVVLADTEQWFHYTKDVGDTHYTSVSSGSLPESARPGDSHHMLLIAVEDSGWLFLDGRLVSRLDLDHNTDHGWVSLLGDFWNRDRGEPEFRDFNVWAP